MVLDCHACVDGTTSGGLSCGICGGDGEIDLLDDAFKQIPIGAEKALMGVVWSTLLTNQADMADKLNDCLDKLNDIKEVVDEL